jgi:polyisoprenyl-teichoic acid--peptidoglycan teichoic acid transferase
MNQKYNHGTTPKPAARLTIGQIVLLAAGLALAVGLFFFLRGFVACWRFTALPGMAPSNCGTMGSNPNPQATPEPGTAGTPEAATDNATPTASAPLTELPPPWDGGSRVTILVIGLDYRDWQVGEGAPRSDTMILLTLDPVTKTAGMLTIPRDLWVNIPGFGYGKINTAYSLGEGSKLPGGGPGLAARTVENVIGVPITYYAQVDFSTFITFIDAIGGVKVVPSETIDIQPMNTEQHYVLKAGESVTLDGALALAYARNRHATGDDAGRSARQLEVIMGIRERVTNPGYWPGLLANSENLYNQLSSGINTNMSFNDALRLGMVAKDVPLDSIQRGVIGYEQVLIAKSPDGLDILIPLPDKIRELRDQIFTAGGTLSPMAQGDTVSLMKEEAARVSVLNASGVNGLAAKTGEYLTSQGMNVVNTGNPAEYPGYTLIIDHSGKPYALRYLMELMGVGPNHIRIRFDPNPAADIEVLLGPEWGMNNPMP